jgi:hypothetical protein
MPDLTRAVTAAAIWGVVSAGLILAAGLPLDLMNVATDAGVMGAATLGSDVIHDAAQMQPDMLTSALATGGLFAGGMRLLRNSEAYLTNGLAGAGVDLATDKLMYKMAKSPAA